MEFRSEGNKLGYVKICGITKKEEIEYLNKTLPDFAGFVLFVDWSKRNLDIDAARELIKELSEKIKSVAVTVLPTMEQIKKIEDAGFDCIQIHGDISDDVLSSISIPIIKAFNVSDLSSFDRYSKTDKVMGYVFDASTPGSGTSFDWDKLKNIPTDGKLRLLAGGLTPDNVRDALNKTGLDGADTSSGVENDNKNGKSYDKIVDFIDQVKI